MSNIYITNYNFYNSNVRLRFNNSDCKNTSMIKYNYTMPNLDKYNRRKSDIRQITQDFKRNLKNYIANSIRGKLNSDSEDDMDD